MEDFQPLVSIVIPVYNGSNYMKEAIDSALAQTYSNIEVIVVNDGSTDSTEQIALSYGEKIRYFAKDNGCVSSALNVGIANMRGSYFSWLSHDDIYTPDKIAMQVNALQSLAVRDTLILCGWTYIDEKSQPIRNKQSRCSLPYGAVLPWGNVLHYLLEKGTFNGCALLIPKAAFDICGKFDERLRFNQDGFMWNKIFLSGFSLLRVTDECVKSRIHSGQLTHRAQDVFHRDCETMSEYLIPALDNISSKNDNFLFEYICYNAKYGNWNVAKKACRASGKAHFGLTEYAAILLYRTYGIVRPYIRKLYYKMRKLL